MARPKSPDQVIRHKTLGVRVSVTEWAALKTKAEAAGMTVAEWLRSAGLSRPAPAGIVPALNREAWAALARSAGDLSQLAEAVNQGRDPGLDVKVLQALYGDIQTLRQQLLGIADDPEYH